MDKKLLLYLFLFIPTIMRSQDLVYEKIMYLPDELQEISGLAFCQTSGHLLAVNDEQGVYFHLSADTGEILDSVRFHKDGDFEGIEWSHDKVFVLRSDRKLFAIDKESKDVTSIHSKKKGDGEYEGLCFDADHNRLLVARKFGKKDSKPIWIYALDLDQIELGTKKLFQIDLDPFLQEHQGASKKTIEHIQRFAPSAIAIHPLTREIYILSGPGEVLAIYTAKGKYKSSHLLSNSLLPQPEGLCFDTNGRLYIASEGQKKQGRIVVYKLD